MTKRFALTASATAALLAGLIAAPASTGADPQSTVTVTASVAASCSITAATLAFGAYDPVNANASSPSDASGEIIVRCTQGSSGAKIDLGAGQHNTSNTQRKMAHETDGTVQLRYEIYKDGGRTQVWGTGDNGTERTGADLNGSGLDVKVTMYGRIPEGQLQAISGNYTDTLISTIYF
jgi:spore coat protein U-like protein